MLSNTLKYNFLKSEDQTQKVFFQNPKVIKLNEKKTSEGPDKKKISIRNAKRHLRCYIISKLTNG